MPRSPKVRWHANANAWRADVGPHGKTGRRTPVYWREIANTAKGRREAQDQCDAYVSVRDRDEENRTRGADNPPVTDLVDLYLDHSQATVDERTYQTHATRLNLWMSRAEGATEGDDKHWMDHRLARSLGPADLSRVIRAMMAEGYSPHYVAGMARSVKACWAWAARLDEDRKPPRILPDDVFRDVRLPRIPAAPERYFPPDRAAALLNWIDARADAMKGVTGDLERLTALLFRCIYDSGCRPHELCEAAPEDFDADASVIVRRKHKNSRKTGKPRRLPLPAATRDRLVIALRREGSHPEFLFTHKRAKASPSDDGRAARAGEPWTVGALGQKFRMLRKRSGLNVNVVDGTGREPESDPECTLYDLRRSFSTDADLADVSEQHAADTQGNSPEMQRRIYRTRQAKAAVGVAEAVAAKRRGSGDS